MIYETFEDHEKNIHISAGKLLLPRNITFGENIEITVRGILNIGEYSRFGSNIHINGEEVIFGSHTFHYEPGLRIGGGGSDGKHAKFKCGDRCVLHNNYINIARPVILGNDVGLSPDTKIITHGFWQSVLEGYPRKFEGVQIGDGVIVGQGCMILPGSHIVDNIVVGAQSTVSKPLLEEKSVYAGSPAKFIRNIKPLGDIQKVEILEDIIDEYNKYSNDLHKVRLVSYPIISYRYLSINVENSAIDGLEDLFTDNLRDHLRRYGIRVYTTRPFGKFIC